MYAERGDLDRALAMYRAAADLVPGYAYAWHDMFAALHARARTGQVDVPAMRAALDNAKRTGAGQPGLGATYLAQLEGVLEGWARRATAGPGVAVRRPRRAGQPRRPGAGARKRVSAKKTPAP